eukprot:1142983-Pelagomonas_calceolata.AAC.2
MRRSFGYLANADRHGQGRVRALHGKDCCHHRLREVRGCKEESEAVTTEVQCDLWLSLHGSEVRWGTMYRSHADPPGCQRCSEQAHPLTPGMHPFSHMLKLLRIGSSSEPAKAAQAARNFKS